MLAYRLSRNEAIGVGDQVFAVGSDIVDIYGHLRIAAVTDLDEVLESLTENLLY